MERISYENTNVLPAPTYNYKKTLKNPLASTYFSNMTASMNSDQKTVSLSKFADETSMHGLSNVFKTKSKSRKVIWVLFLVSALSASLFYIITRLSDYLSYSASSTSRDQYDNIEHTLPFPAVTICNNNPFLFSRNRLRSNLVREIVDLLLQIELDRSFTPPDDEYKEFLCVS